MIRNAIDNAVNYLTLNWPLQQFVAINPLWDKIETPLPLLSGELNEKVGLSATLSLDKYHQFYIDGGILSSDLGEAITQLLLLYGSRNGLISGDDFLKTAILNFLTDEAMQLQCQEEEFNLNKKQPYVPFITKRIEQYFFDSPFEWVKSSCLNWISVFFDQRGSGIYSASKNDRMFPAWRELVINQEKWRRILSYLPVDTHLLIGYLFDKLNIPEADREAYIFHILWELKGWSSYNKWLSKNPTNPWTDKSACFESIIALWLVHEYYFIEVNNENLEKNGFSLNSKSSSLVCQLSDIELKIWKSYYSEKISNGDQPVEFKLNIFILKWIWQTAREINYHKRLLKQLEPNLQGPQNSEKKSSPDVQWVFCIDTRSEGLRRHLEAEDSVETFGFAGFFGFAFQLKNKHDSEIRWQSPALLTPTQIVSCVESANSFIRSSATSLKKSINISKENLLAAPALFEIMGPWFGFISALKTFTPSAIYKLLKKSPDKISIDLSSDKNELDLDVAAQTAEGLLRAIGLTDKFARTVIICGHKATSANNPYQTALDCGACGGNAGFVNAAVACEVFNNPLIRARLAQRGLSIPKDTHFIAACHDTTLDEIEWHSNNFPENFNKIKINVEVACSKLREERLQSLPGNFSLLDRATNWSELIPEWGLVNNRSIIIAPRWLTQNVDLKRQSFLHSYNPDEDEDGSILESILTAPLVVAHWINAQYYFSSTDPEIYGSGNKALHNLNSQLGVILGNQSDLQLGLPIQSVAYQGELVHEPRRLFAVIYAKKSVVSRIIEKHIHLKRLIEGQWIFMHIIEPLEGV